MIEKTSVLRKEIEQIWHSDDLQSNKLRLKALMSQVKMKSKLYKNRLLMEIDKTNFKDDLDRLAANCLLKYEGHGVI